MHRRTEKDGKREARKRHLRRAVICLASRRTGLAVRRENRPTVNRTAREASQLFSFRKKKIDTFGGLGARKKLAERTELS